LLFNNGLAANKHQFVSVIENLKGLEGTSYDFTRGIITSHSIESYTHILLALLFLAELEGYSGIDVAAILAGGMG
jgi:hypothetical protein